MLNPTYTYDQLGQPSRVPEVGDGTCFSGGVNNAGLNTPGIGIGIDAGAIVGTPEQFTLLNQHELPRSPATGGAIGGFALGEGGTWQLALEGVILITGDNNVDGDGTIDNLSAVELTDLNTGWTLFE